MSIGLAGGTFSLLFSTGGCLRVGVVEIWLCQDRRPTVSERVTFHKTSNFQGAAAFRGLSANWLYNAG